MQCGSTFYDVAPLSLILKGHNSHQGPPEGSEAEAGTRAGSPDPSRPLPVLRGEVYIWGVGSWELGGGCWGGGVVRVTGLSTPAIARKPQALKLLPGLLSLPGWAGEG